MDSAAGQAAYRPPQPVSRQDHGDAASGRGWDHPTPCRCPQEADGQLTGRWIALLARRRTDRLNQLVDKTMVTPPPAGGGIIRPPAGVRRRRTASSQVDG